MSILKFSSPFKSSNIKLACEFLNEYHIKENDTVLIVAKINDIFYRKEYIENDGWLRLDKATVAINGLDGYALPKLIERYKYAKPKNE